MPIATEEVERRVRVLSAGIRDAGFRLTPQRLEVIREIAGDETHPDVETVYHAVRERMPTISLDTVYRTLAVLTEQGLIDRVNVTAGPTRYDGNPFPHHHFICTRCGLVRDIDEADIATIAPTEKVESLGDVESVQIQYRGVCSSCRKAEATADGRKKRR